MAWANYSRNGGVGDRGKKKKFYPQANFPGQPWFLTGRRNWKNSRRSFPITVHYGNNRDGAELDGKDFQKIDFLYVHKCLIFTNFLATMDRQSLVRRFQIDNSVKAFIMTQKTSGTRLNLTTADYIFIFDPW